MKKLVKLFITIVAVVFLVKYCTSNYGSVINLPGGLGGNDSEESSGGWFGQKEKSGDKTSDKEVPKDIRDLEKQLGIGNDDGPATSTNIPSTTTTSSSPLSFKGIPIKGSSSAFGKELVKAGFNNSGNGVYTGDFAGYSGCKVTPSGNNPVQTVRVDFPVISDWDALEKAYDSLQASLTQKYGMEPVVNGNVAVYNLPNGSITLDADVRNQPSWHVILTYSNLAAPSSTGTLGRNPIDDL